MKIRSTAPNRVDLAGGTLDIHPLYVFEGESVTVNVAIDIASHVEVETRDDDRIVLRSEDLGETVEFSDLEHVELGHKLDLLARAVRFFGGRGVTVQTRNDAPKGSGLGASSALLMALMGALARLTRTPLVGDNIIDWGANLEAQNLGIPTGKQDYYAAVYGGLSAITFAVKGARRDPISVEAIFLRELESAMILSFTGISHFSGTNNWAMMKRYIDGQGDTVPRLRAIKETAYRMRDALQAQDLGAVAKVLAEEWNHRKGLAEGVSTPEIEKMMAAAQDAGAYASKICGAGGGGCMVTLAPQGARAAVEQALRQTGARVLPFHISKEGLEIGVLEASGASNP